MSTGEPQEGMILANGHANNGADTSLKIFKREPQNRIFVNRGLHLDKIKFYGFDMDYTLAVYKSPDYESMGFNLLKERLVQIGYPEAIRHFEYDASFPVRGLWFDKLYGNLLKVDSYGNILVCVHGFQFLKPHEVAELYPNKYIQLDDKRIYVLNTLFNIPETYMLACVVDFFANNSEYTKTKTGITMGSIHISYKSIFQDVRGAVDWLHDHGDMKTSTLSNLDKYIHRDEKLAILLERIRHVGAKCVLITNSGYDYTNKIMEYLLDFPETAHGKRHWTSYWDCVIVNAAKPLFFEDGTILRRVDTSTGALSLGRHLGPIARGDIYSGGSCEVVSRLLGAKGSDVLYVGDHIFGDILKSKKIRGWRTFLIIPELAMELKVWTDKRQLFESLTRIEMALSDIYRHLDSSTNQTPDTSHVSHSLRTVVHELDMSYGMLGSLFRSGSRQTFFASQVRRYADIYAASILNLLHYPFCYMFRAPAMLMPHEATVDHHAGYEPELQPAAAHRSRSSTDAAFETPVCKRQRATGDLPHAWAETPREMVHIHDDADSEEERSVSPYSNSSPDTEDKEQGRKKISALEVK